MALHLGSATSSQAPRLKLSAPPGLLAARLAARCFISVSSASKTAVVTAVVPLEACRTL